MGYFIKHVTPAFWEHFLDSKRGTVGSGERRRRKARTIGPLSDVFICYLGGEMAWCGVLGVAGPLLSPDDPRLPGNDPWRKKFPLQFPVECHVALRSDQWISVKDPYIWSHLECTDGKSNEERGWSRRTGFGNDLQELSSHDGAFLAHILTMRAQGVPLPNEADSGLWDPRGVEDTRDRKNRSIAIRRGQKEFRDSLLSAYGNSCAVTGCTVLDVLEAAHIKPHLGVETNHVANGLLLRTDIHMLFDCGLIAIHPTRLTVAIHPSLRDSEYWALDGQPLKLPPLNKPQPSPSALCTHAKKWWFTFN